MITDAILDQADQAYHNGSLQTNAGPVELVTRSRRSGQQQVRARRFDSAIRFAGRWCMRP